MSEYDAVSIPVPAGAKMPAGKSIGRFRPALAPGLACFIALLALFGSKQVLRPSTEILAMATDEVTTIQCSTVPWLKPLHACRNIGLLELAETTERAQEVLNALTTDRDVRAAAVKNVELDYLLIPSYVAFLVLLNCTIGRVAGVLKWRALRVFSIGVAVLQPVAGILDGLENIGLFAMLAEGTASDMVHRWTLIVSTSKWCLITLGLLGPLVPVFVLVEAEVKKRLAPRIAGDIKKGNDGR